MFVGLLPLSVRHNLVKTSSQGWWCNDEAKLVSMTAQSCDFDDPPTTPNVLCDLTVSTRILYRTIPLWVPIMKKNNKTFDIYSNRPLDYWENPINNRKKPRCWPTFQLKSKYSEMLLNILTVVLLLGHVTCQTSSTQLTSSIKQLLDRVGGVGPTPIGIGTWIRNLKNAGIGTGIKRCPESCITGVGKLQDCQDF